MIFSKVPSNPQGIKLNITKTTNSVYLKYIYSDFVHWFFLTYFTCNAKLGFLNRVNDPTYYHCISGNWPTDMLILLAKQERIPVMAFSDLGFALLPLAEWIIYPNYLILRLKRVLKYQLKSLNTITNND